MGIELPWYNLKEALIDEETVNLIGQLAYENDVPFDLIRSMILVTYKNKNYTNTKVLKDSLDKLIRQQWLHYDILKEIENED